MTAVYGARGIRIRIYEILNRGYFTRVSKVSEACKWIAFPTSSWGNARRLGGRNGRNQVEIRVASCNRARLHPWAPRRRAAELSVDRKSSLCSRDGQRKILCTVDGHLINTNGLRRPAASDSLPENVRSSDIEAASCDACASPK
jgi:hypothetical protein